jgi:hypothetical protein
MTQTHSTQPCHNLQFEDKAVSVKHNKAKHNTLCLCILKMVLMSAQVSVVLVNA